MTFAIADIFSTFNAADFCTFQTVYILIISSIDNSTWTVANAAANADKFL